MAIVARKLTTQFCEKNCENYRNPSKLGLPEPHCSKRWNVINNEWELQPGPECPIYDGHSVEVKTLET